MKSKVFLAPMADVTEAAFRILCSRYGAGFTYTEMISATALARKKENKLFDVQDCEKNIGVQLMGSNLDDIATAVKLVEKKVDLIDFNMGCPMKKIVNNSCGAALLREPKKVKEICQTLVASTKKPVSIKIRSGWDNKSINALKIAKIAEDAGINRITIHPKTQHQLRSGVPDWKLIKKIKDKLSIPVIGNGGIETPEDAKQMFSETGCDYVMIGRVASKNPYIFKQVNDYLATGEYDSKGWKEMFSEYLELASKYKSNLGYVKGHAVYFTKGTKGGAKLRIKISQAKSVEEIKKIIV
jgi:tRNA-dihydrouridine synthase B